MTPDLERQLSQVRGSWNVESVEVVLDVGRWCVALVSPLEAAETTTAANWGQPTKPFLMQFVDSTEVH